MRDNGPMADEEWYWDLSNKVAVPARERGPSMRVLGPYPSKAAAENWRTIVEERNAVADVMIEKELDQVINMKVAHFYVLFENVQKD